MDNSIFKNTSKYRKRTQKISVEKYISFLSLYKNITYFSIMKIFLNRNNINTSFFIYNQQTIVYLFN